MEKVDRRTRNTQEKIKKSFWTLMKEHSFQDISVSQIASIADINRSTFYTHYTDKYDLLLEIIHDLLDFNLVQRDDLLAEMADYFDCIQAHQELLLLLFRDQSMAFFKEDVKIVWRHHFPADLRTDKSYKLRIITAIFMESTEWWLANEGAVTNEGMASRVLKLMSAVSNIDGK